MQPIEIIVILACVIIVGGVFANYLYRKAKHLPTGECSCCSHNKKGKKLVQMYHKKYEKEK